ncbi:MAG TPA: M17 family peptidase N-terminal domain-containing protein, partial [Terriglobales bacterium]|nr:M17 family peptidase N-terminal domain-containing protein [Terriglobales bacterium]
MKTKLILGNIAEVQAECLAIVVLDHNIDKSKDAKPQPKAASADKVLGEAVNGVLETGDVTGKSLESTLIHHPSGLKAKRLLLVGGGKAAKFNADEARRVAGTAIRFAKSKNLKSVTISVPENTAVTAEAAARAFVEGAFVGDFDPNYYQSDRKDQKIDELTILAPNGSDKKSLEAAIEVGRIVGESQNFTRDLVNEPGNKMTPTIMGQRAKKMSAEVGLKCEVYGKEKLMELKMGSFWSVSQGSAEPPALIVMHYEPAGAPAEPVVGLVGKGITFDTGGISIKPADGMEKMKYDMAGGAAMIGAMRAIALLKPNVRVIGIVCAAENMPSSTAQKPGDVQFAMNGKAIEIINTDAEG